MGEEVRVGVRENLEAHFVAHLLEVVEDGVGHVQSGVLAELRLEDSEHEAAESG